MARSFVAKDDATGQLAIRKPREGDQLFRGTPRYCSLNTHYRKEQVIGFDVVNPYPLSCLIINSGSCRRPMGVALHARRAPRWIALESPK